MQLKCHKAQSVSLSGKDQLGSRNMLKSSHTLQWHDKKDPTTTVYLNYPLTKSIKQTFNYLDSIIAEFK
jgi:hypothetical protein